jgi:hypothetical protein
MADFVWFKNQQFLISVVLHDDVSSSPYETVILGSVLCEGFARNEGSSGSIANGIHEMRALINPWNAERIALKGRHILA